MTAPILYNRNIGTHLGWNFHNLLREGAQGVIKYALESRKAAKTALKGKIEGKDKWPKDDGESAVIPQNLA